MKHAHLTPILLIGLLLILSSLPTVQAATDCAAVSETGIPQAQCDTLLALYNSTDGANWSDKTGWNETNAPCSWKGITCSGGNVTNIGLASNNLKGSLPTLSALTGLQILDLSWNQLTGTLPDLSQLTNLRILYLQYNQFTGTILDWSKLTKLRNLYLDDNQLTGTIPDWSMLTSLQALILNNNQLTGTIPDLSKLTNLQRFYLNNNQLTGTIPDLSKLTSLRYIVLNNNPLTGTIPDLSKLTSLLYLGLSGNQLTGTLPDWSMLTNLQNLSLNDNQLTGTIPDWSMLTNLQNLYLSRNQLTGTIPAWSKLTNLRNLYLSNNQLTGTIPDWSMLTSLPNLVLNNNQLTGTIPDWSMLTSLRMLYLSANQLSGPIPSLNTLTKLTTLALSSNPQLCRDANADYGTRTEVNSFPLCASTSNTATSTGAVNITPPTVIPTNTTWTLANSPYVISNNTVVSQDATLTIEAGVQVKFDKDQTLQIDGTLIARGTATNPIVFTANSADNWGNIFFSATSTNAAYDASGNHLSGSILEYCTIEKAGGAQIADNGAVRMDNAHPYLNHLTVRNNKASGIHGWNLSGTLRIANSTISDNTSSSNGAGINVNGSGTGTFYLSNSTISNNDSSLANSSGGGIYSTVANATITNNTITNNKADGSDSAGGGLHVFGTATISSNIITNNSADAGGGIKVFDGQVNLASNYIANNTARNGAGVYDYGAGNIANNIISDNTARSGIGGIGVPATARDRTFSNNTFTGNTALNQIIDEVQGTFQYNTITQNQTTGSADTHIVSIDTSPQLNNNNIFGNTATYAVSAVGGQGKTFSAINNWWGTTKESDIQNWIFDVTDDTTKGTVTATPWASVIRTDAPIAPPTGLTATAGTGKITLTWTANTESDTTGYKVYWDTQDVIHPYANMKDVGKVTAYTLTALNAGIYHVAVTAYDKDYALTKDDTNTIVNDNQTQGHESWYARTTATIDTTVCNDIIEIPQTQCEALLALYNGTEGPNWTSKAGWNVSTTPCTPPVAWEGITCVDGNVTEINLTDHQLKGTLPDLSPLTSLLKLQLGTNQLTGAFPDLTKFTQLQVLDLSKNKFTGKLPGTLSSQVKLQKLLLNDNQFSDLIPALNGLINLDTLLLNNNLLVGPLPALDKLTKAKLTTFDLSGNTTTGTTALCKDPTRAYGDWAKWDNTQGNWITPNDPTSLDAFPTCTGTLSGKKFNDILDNYPADALQDMGEPNLPGQTITVTNMGLNRLFTATDSVTGQTLTATLDTNGKYFVTATTANDGTFKVTLPYDTYAITSDNATYPQQTTPVRMPPLSTPYTAEISWLNKEIKEVLFGVYGPRTLTLSKTQASDTSLANQDNSVTATTTGPDSKISCTASAGCPLHYTQGQTVTLTATAKLTGSTWAGWSGDNECAPTKDAKGKVKNVLTNPLTITMDKDKSCKANFRVFSCANVTGITEEQCSALVSLFDSTNGKTWTTHLGWRETLTPCSWSGVSCVNGNVTGIALANNNLIGTLPSDFSALTELQNFDVSSNIGLSSAVPTSLTTVLGPTGTMKNSGTKLCQNIYADYGDWSYKPEITGLGECEQLAPVAAFNIPPPKGSLTVALKAANFGEMYNWETSCVPTTNPTATPTPGPTTTGQEASITFAEAGICTITLTVTDSQGQSSKYTQANVKVPVTTSTSVKTGSTSAAAFYTILSPGSSTVQLDASLSVSTDWVIDTYTWTTKCGTPGAMTNGPSTTGRTASLPLPEGTCEITLTVSNSAASTNTSTQANTITQTVTVPATESKVIKVGDVSGVVFKISPPQNNLTVNLDASMSSDPEGGQLQYKWTTDCGQQTTTGMTTALTFTQPATCKITLTVTDSGGKSNSVTHTVTVPAAILTIYKTSKNTAGDEVSSSGRVLVTQPKGAIPMPDADCDPAICVPDKQQYSFSPGNTVQLTAKPYPGSTFTGWGPDCGGTVMPGNRISFVIGEGYMDCTANFDLANPPPPPPMYKLEVQLWDIKTNQQTDTVGGQIIDSRLSINVGNGNKKSYTYYQSGADASGVNRTARVRLRGIPNHIEKVNSGANVYWEFTRWDCYNAGNSNEKVPLIKNSVQTRPLVVFDMPAYSTICRAYFNGEQDIAGQVLRTKTYKEGVIDTGGTPGDRYPMDLGTTPYDTNAARFREGLSWAQPAILTLESLVDPKNLDATWPTQFLDVDFFKPSLAGTVVEGKKWTKSVRIRPKDAEVKGFSSIGTVLGYYIEVRVMLLRYPDKVEEEVPILLLYGDSTGPRRGTRSCSSGVGAVKWPPNAGNQYKKC